MKLPHCTLTKKHQLKLIACFVLKVISRPAASLLGIQADSAALFYLKLGKVTAYYLEQEAPEILHGAVE